MSVGPRRRNNIDFIKPSAFRRARGRAIASKMRRAKKKAQQSTPAATTIHLHLNDDRKTQIVLLLILILINTKIHPDWSGTIYSDFPARFHSHRPDYLAQKTPRSMALLSRQAAASPSWFTSIIFLRSNGDDHRLHLLLHFLLRLKPNQWFMVHNTKTQTVWF